MEYATPQSRLPPKTLHSTACAKWPCLEGETTVSTHLKSPAKPSSRLTQFSQALGGRLMLTARSCLAQAKERV